jgi:hypothetical protein
MFLRGFEFGGGFWAATMVVFGLFVGLSLLVAGCARRFRGSRRYRPSSTSQKIGAMWRFGIAGQDIHSKKPEESRGPVIYTKVVCEKVGTRKEQHDWH